MPTALGCDEKSLLDRGSRTPRSLVEQRSVYTPLRGIVSLYAQRE